MTMVELAIKINWMNSIEKMIIERERERKFDEMEKKRENKLRN